jgi:hypothetical protein
VLSQGLTKKEWAEAAGELQLRQFQSGEIIYGPDGQELGPDSPYMEYLQMLRDNPDPETGGPNFEIVEALRTEKDDVWNQVVDDNIGMRLRTPLMDAKRDMRPLLQQYYSLPKYDGYSAKDAREIDRAWELLKANAEGFGGDQEYAFYQMAEKGGLSDAALNALWTRVQGGELKGSAARDQFKLQYPEVGIFTEWGFMSPPEIEWLAERGYIDSAAGGSAEPTRTAPTTPTAPAGPTPATPAMPRYLPGRNQ